MKLSSRDRRWLTAAAGVVAGMAVLAVAFGLLRATHDPRPAIVGRAPVPGSPPPSTLPARVLSDRDPFSSPPALRAAPGPSASPTLDDQTPGPIPPEPTATGSVSTPPTSTPPSTTPPSPPADCGDARPSECRSVGGHVIVLLRVLSRHPRPSVDLELDGDPITNLREGDWFADGFKVVGFNDSLCPRFVFGTDGFTLCEHHRRS
jgi:hypothetical protein